MGSAVQWGETLVNESGRGSSQALINASGGLASPTAAVTNMGPKVAAELSNAPGTRTAELALKMAADSVTLPPIPGGRGGPGGSRGF
jgi:hypothetical protein